MNPGRVRELDRKGDAVVAMINAIPAGRTYDMAGHIDAKRAAASALRSLLAEMRNGLACGEPAKVLIRADRLGQAIFSTATARRRA